MAKHLNQQSGFTLLELLMVVIIVGILATLALPAYIRASEKARTAEVTSVLGALKNAAQRYCADTDGAITPAVLADLDTDNPLTIVGLGVADTAGNPARWTWPTAPAAGSITPASVLGAIPIGTALGSAQIGVQCAAAATPFVFDAAILRATGPCANTEVQYRSNNVAQPITVIWAGQCV